MRKYNSRENPSYTEMVPTNRMVPPKQANLNKRKLSGD